VPANDRNVATDISNIKMDSASDIEKKSAKGTSILILLDSKPSKCSKS